MIVPSPSHEPRMQSVPTGLTGERRTPPPGAAPPSCAARALAATSPECLPHATPTMYSPSPASIETTNSGGLGHCLPPSLSEHLSGSTAPGPAEAI